MSTSPDSVLPQRPPRPGTAGPRIARRSFPATSGIIMDGNGRWAKARGKPRTEGHLEGVKAAKRVVAAAAEAGLAFLSLYTFSTENWARAEEEVSYLMFLVRSYLRKEYDFYRENGIRIVHSGDMDAAAARHRQGDRRGDPRHGGVHGPDGESLHQLRRQGRDHPRIHRSSRSGAGEPAHRGILPAATSTSPSFPIPTSSSAARTSSGSPTSSSGSPPTPSCTSAPSSGRTGTGRTCGRRSPNTADRSRTLRRRVVNWKGFPLAHAARRGGVPRSRGPDPRAAAAPSPGVQHHRGGRHA